MTDSIQEFKLTVSRILNMYEILLMRKDKETNKKLTELGIEFNEKLETINQETLVILKDTSWRNKID
mgnify:CR=1 FL=1